MARRPPGAGPQAEDASSVDSRTSLGFGGTEFWDALRQVGSDCRTACLNKVALHQVILACSLANTADQVCIAQVKGLESEVRYQLTEARIVLRRRNVTPLMVGRSAKTALSMPVQQSCTGTSVGDSEACAA